MSFTSKPTPASAVPDPGLEPRARRTSPAAAGSVENGWLAAASDADLVLAAGEPGREGKEAFVEIVRRHQTAVCAVAWSVTGRMGLADDIAQETFLKAWRRLATLREPAKLRAWLTRIAHDCAVDALQREKPHVSLDSLDASEELVPGPAVVCGAAAPDKAAAEAEEEALVWSSLAALPETLRMPLVLFYQEGQSVAAVAAALDLSEEAMRQRLSRGRQALRAAVETRIETVLGRIQPSALLVVGVAAGIGLLTKPAALAASAVSALAATSGSAAGAAAVPAAAAASASGAAATAAAAGKTAAGAAGISTIMTATTWLAAAITLAAFLPVGWTTGSAGGWADTSTASPLPAVMAAGPTDPFAAFPNSKLLAEWRRLHLIHGSDAAAMSSLYRAIQAEIDGFHRDSLTLALMAEWAVVDPQGAFRVLWSEKKNQDHTALMMREWLKLDPAKAAACLGANLSGAETLAATLMPDVAILAPDHFVALFSSLPEATAGKYTSSSELPSQIAEAFEIFARSHLEAAKDALPLLKGRIQVNAQAAIASLMATKDPAAAMEWAAALDPETNYLAVMAASRIWSRTDPAAALSHFPPNFEKDGSARILGTIARDDLATGLRLWREKAETFSPLVRPAMGQAVQEGLQKDPLATLQLLADERPEIQDKFFKTDPYGAQGLYRGLDTAQRNIMWEWIAGQKLAGMAGHVADGLLNTEFSSDPESAIRRFTGLPEEWQARLAGVTENRGNLTDSLTFAQCSQLLQSAAPVIPPPLLAAFFGKTDPGTEPDIPYWRSQVDTLPAESREMAVSAFTGNLARTDPRQALEFAESLPEGGPRQAAFNKVADAWTTTDTHAASAWVAGLPPGRERDAAAAGLVKSLPIGDTEAALTWAGTITDPQLRIRSLQDFLKAAQGSDPDKIPALLQNPLISPADREALRLASPGK